MSDQTTPDTQDIGRAINIIIVAMQKHPVADPAQTVLKYVSDDLRHFKHDNTLDIFNGMVRVNGIPPFRLLPGGLIRPGGTGIVFQVANANAPVEYALKFVRPTFFDKPENRDEYFTDSQKEFLRHAPLSHNNVARILGTTRLVEERQGMGLIFEPIMMEWIDGATPLLKHLINICSTPTPDLFSDLVSLIVQCFSALSYIHDHGIIHWDLKSDNLLVNKSKVVKLTDFGNARFPADRTRSDFAITTKGHFPPALDGHLDRTDDDDVSSNRTKIRLPDKNSWDCSWLDMWMLARELMTIIGDSKEPWGRSTYYREPPSLKADRYKVIDSITHANDDRNEYLLECLRLILRRILHPSTPQENRFYHHPSEVVEDLLNLEPEFGGAQDVAELWAVPQRVMRLPVSGNAPFTTRISRVYDSAPVKRLSNHRQLGPIYQVYRGAIHTRAEHAEGVLCTTCDYVRALFADQTNPFWRVNIKRRDIELLLFAALVHDIGHVAFGHFIEELDGLLRGRKHERYLLAVLDPPLFDQDVPWMKSVDIAADRTSLISAITDGWGPTAETDARAFMRDVARILQPTSERIIQFDEAASYDSDACESIKIHVLHSILDSAIDADKFDYLLRDALHSGVRYANGIDDDRFLQTLTVISDFANFRKPADGEPIALRPCIGVSQKGIQPLETVLIARYQMFRSVYWHHTARAQTAMLHFLILEHLIATMRTAAKGEEPSRLLDRALDKLLRQCRTRDDDGAIIWLRKQIKASIGDQQTKEKLLQICDCLLGNRDYLYHEVFELGYDKAHAQTRYSLYKSLSDWSQEVNNQTGDGVTYLQAIGAKRRSLTEALTARLEIELANGDVLLDVPPAGKDQIDNVYVHFGGEIRSIYDVSPMGQAVRDTFAKWTRSVRVFFHPVALERCLKNGMTLPKLQIECKAALDEIQDQQQRLKFPASAT